MLNVTRKKKIFKALFLRTLKSLVISLCIGISSSGWTAVELALLSPQEQKSLIADFKASKPPIPRRLEDTSWDCRVYGLKSKNRYLDVKHMYAFKMEANTSLPHQKQLINSGSRRTPSFQIIGDKLIGNFENHHDELRINSQGQLLALISTENNNTLALAKCD